MLAHDAADVTTLARLGVAYREDGRLEEARTTLRQAVALQPTHPAAVFYLGLTYEDLDEPVAARGLYQAYLEHGRSAELKRRLRGRLLALEQHALRLAVRQTIAQEVALGEVDPQPGTVAVFPFLYHGDDPELQPLSRAMAELLVTDLAQTDRLRVLERTRVQMLLDEMKLGEGGLVDPQTAVRGGRLLSAGRIVQGQIDGDEALLRLQAAVVGIGGEWDRRPITEANALRRLFEMQKRLALGIFQSLGVELTPAERERVMRQPTSSLEALLAFGRCLEAEDAGDYARAATQCRRAVALDAGFGLARDRAARVVEIAGTARVSTRQLGEMGLVEFLGATTLGGIEESLTPLQELLPDVRGRSAAAESLGTEGFTDRARLEIILRRP